MSLVQAAWNWNTGTPEERANTVRRHAFSGRSIPEANLLTLFNLTDVGLRRILAGDTWRPEYDIDHVPPTEATPMTKHRRRAPKIKPGELIAYYGYADGRGPDLCVNWGGAGAEKADGRLLISALCAQVHEGREFLIELERRGYDLNTLRFSIKQRSGRPPSC